MNRQNYFLVESPLQIINAFEAINSFNLKNYKIFIRYSGNFKNDRQLDRLIKILAIDSNKIKKIKILAKNKNFTDWTKIIFLKIYFRFIQIDKLFIGNLESGFFSTIYKNINRTQVIGLDDGSKTISLQSKFTKDNYYNLFTMYRLTEIKYQKIYLNDYSGIKNMIKDKNKIDKILFLGADLVEMCLISEEKYLLLITKISEHYNKNIIYIPHRHEDERKLKKISKFRNFEIKNIDYPVELYGLYEKEIPNTVASFYSTALLSMQNIYGIQSESFYFDFSNSEHKESIDSVYEYYKKEMKVINLND